MSGVGEGVQMGDSCAASMVMNMGVLDRLPVHGRYRAECIGADGKVKWVEEFDNVVTDAGKKLALDTILAGSAFTATTRMGLKGTGSAAAADTQASHAGWLEVGLANAPTYTGNRPTPSFSAAAGAGTVSKATSAAVAFAITSTGTVAGAFININGSATKDDTTGTLFSAGDFSVSRSVINGDTVNVSYTLSS